MEQSDVILRLLCPTNEDVAEAVHPTVRTLHHPATGGQSRLAKAALKKVRAELVTINQSAVASLDEGFEETLTLHRLGVFAELGTSFKTTNCIENLNALIGRRTDKIDCWRKSEQKHRWLATVVLEIEPRLRKVREHRHLPRLRAALQSLLKIRSAEVA